VSTRTASPPDTRLLARLRLAKDAMDRDWAEPLDLGAVAAAAGYSRYHFVRLFREAYGETPGHYLSRRRIERAQELLRSANLTVTEICMIVGFTSLGTLHTVQAAGRHDAFRVPRPGQDERHVRHPRLFRPLLGGRLPAGLGSLATFEKPHGFHAS
jgi:AraC-like DNA-binding protein